MDDIIRHCTRIVLVFLAVISSLASCGHSGAAQPVNKTSAQVPILMYHHIAKASDPKNTRASRLAVSPDQFAEQLAYLQRTGYTTITLDDLVTALRDGAALPAKPVILTFDDGYKDFYTAAYPLLQRYNDKATIYIISGRVGLPDYMTWDDLRALAASPLITIGDHTRHHPQLAKCSATQSWEELTGGKSDLETQLHITVRHLAYPSGSYSTTTLEQARKIGFATAVTVRRGINERADKLLELPRIFVKGDASLDDLIAGLEGQR
jgi:peptidoglycan/xylan/chitin deacetylase (PgdA/CDA1 family)